MNIVNYPLALKGHPRQADPGGTVVSPGDKQQCEPAEYTVTIEEHISQEFSIKAHGIYEAMQFAEAEYLRGSFVVQPSAPNARLIMARDNETAATTEWKEF